MIILIFNFNLFSKTLKKKKSKKQNKKKTNATMENTLPPGWIQCMSKKFKQAYFFNTLTNETSWIHPLVKEKVSLFYFLRYSEVFKILKF